MAPSIEGLWQFCREREAIRLRKEAGQPPPWTDDKTLRKFHFCNIRRQDDFGTRWYMKEIVAGDSNFWGFDDILWKTILYRAVNNVCWFEESGIGVFGIEAWKGRKEEIKSGLERAPLPYSPAYIVLQGPDGKDRKTHLFQLLETMDRLFAAGFADDIQISIDLKHLWKQLQSLPYIGPFISLQIYRDLILAKAIPFSDDDFVYLGPGCRTGIEMLLDLHSYKQQYRALLELQQRVPEDLQPISLGDVEHAVCEWRKFARLSGGKGRRRYYQSHDKS